MIQERATFRYFIGIMAILGGMAGLAGLYFVEVPAGNREPLLLALGVVLGWGGTVMSYEFGSSPAGRRAADAGLRATGDESPGSFPVPHGSVMAPPPREPGAPPPPPPSR